MTHQRTAAATRPTRRRVLSGAAAVGVLTFAPAVVRAQAKALKIAFPPVLLALADEVIE